ncbi:protein yippee-like [Lotus japonicus]|uniref:protein yippee-like n=1 Tax=Lotus japonicus TaxID=34305 RepID=UPI00258D7A92|nr:protein yippee-like [Lotus japonicus]
MVLASVRKGSWYRDGLRAALQGIWENGLFSLLLHGPLDGRWSRIIQKNIPHVKKRKAYLFNKVVNVSLGEKEDRMMMTGLHTVADIFCVGCGSMVSWKYETAHDKGQKYKEGKSVLERYKMPGPDGSNYWISHEANIGGSDADDA